MKTCILLPFGPKVIFGLPNYPLIRLGDSGLSAESCLFGRPSRPIDIISPDGYPHHVAPFLEAEGKNEGAATAGSPCIPSIGPFPTIKTMIKM